LKLFSYKCHHKMAYYWKHRSQSVSVASNKFIFLLGQAIPIVIDSGAMCYGKSIGV
jgi:hypothetical protein